MTARDFHTPVGPNPQFLAMHYFKFRGLAYSFLLASFVYLLVTLALITTAVFGVGLWVTGEEFFMYAVAISAGTFLC